VVNLKTLVERSMGITRTSCPSFAHGSDDTEWRRSCVTFPPISSGAIVSQTPVLHDLCSQTFQFRSDARVPPSRGGSPTEHHNSIRRCGVSATRFHNRVPLSIVREDASQLCVSDITHNCVLASTSIGRRRLLRINHHFPRERCGRRWTAAFARSWNDA